ncbi:MAG: iron ABC transporter permease [Muribaculaceae bacterium]|nr:iron ABC transporter permease [Muribaculaceae bacterium]
MTRETKYILLLIGIIIALAVANILYGSVHIPAKEIVNILLGNEAAKESWRLIILEARLPQMITAILCGAALAASGLILQTAFNNPLAGPSILGIDSGASLGVALVMLSTGGAAGVVFNVSGFLGIIAGAFAGAIAIMGALLMLSTIIKSNVMLLIAGIMIGYVTSSAISLLNFFATAEGVHSYVIWGMGNFGGVSLTNLPYFAIVVAVGLAIAILLVKPLNALLLGPRYAQNLGINLRLTRNLLLLSTGILTAVTTAFCGPIAFVGLAVPHVARLTLGSSNHNALLPITILIGSATTLLCNLICVLPGDNGIIPLNAVTPVLGAPVIIYVIINQRKIQYFN